MGKGKGRRDGEGSVYKRADGRFCAAVSLGRGVDGRRLRKVVYGATADEALRKRDAIRAELAGGGRVQTRRKGSLDDYLETWISATLRMRVDAGDLRESTRAMYAEKMTAYVIGTKLGGMQLEEIRPPDVREWLAWLSTRNTSRRDPETGKLKRMTPGGVRIVWRTLKAALADAVDDEILLRSPTAGVRPPKVTGRPKADPLSLVDAQAVIDQASGDRLEALWIVFLYLGLRHGEALALQWEDVDLEGRKVYVCRSAGWVKSPEDNSRTIVEGRTKTNASEGEVPLPSFVVDALEAHRSRQRVERLAAAVWVRPELVFSSEAGTLLDSSNVRKRWVALCRRAGVRPRRIHDLRHTTATLLLLAGERIEVVSRILRHESVKITSDTYGHILEELQRGAVDALGDLLARKEAT